MLRDRRRRRADSSGGTSHSPLSPLAPVADPGLLWLWLHFQSRTANMAAAITPVTEEPHSVLDPAYHARWGVLWCFILCPPVVGLRVAW